MSQLTAVSAIMNSAGSVSVTMSDGSIVSGSVSALAKDQTAPMEMLESALQLYIQSRETVISEASAALAVVLADATDAQTQLATAQGHINALVPQFIAETPTPTPAQRALLSQAVALTTEGITDSINQQISTLQNQLSAVKQLSLIAPTP